jgi:O-antigen ligase
MTGQTSAEPIRLKQIEISKLSTAVSSRASRLCGELAGLLAFAIPWSDMAPFAFKTQFTRPLAIAVGIVWLLSGRADTTIRRMSMSACVASIFAAFVAGSFLVTPSSERTVRRVLSYFGLLLMMVFMQQAIRSRRTYLSVLKCFIAGCAVTLGGLAWNVVEGHTLGDGRYTAPGFDANDLAGQLALSIPIAFYLASNLVKRALWFRLYLPIAITGVLVTGSRAGLIVLAAACCYPAACLCGHGKRGILGLLVGLVPLVAAVCVFSPNVAFRRLGTIADQVQRHDLNGRFAVWRKGIELFQDKPLIGVGGGEFADTVGDLKLAAHNTYLEVLVEHGVVGLMLFGGIIVGLFARVERFPARERALWRSVLWAWAILIITLSWENREMTWLLWGLCLSFKPSDRLLPSRSLGSRMNAA